MVEENAKSILNDLNSALGEKDQSGQVEAIRELFDKKSIKMKTHMRSNINESYYFSRLYVLSKILGISTLKDYCDEETELRVSNDRLGRQEAVEVSRSHPVAEKQRGFMGKMFGW